jgi:hypothetical protein
MPFTSGVVRLRWYLFGLNAFNLRDLLPAGSKMVRNFNPIALAL